MEISPISVVLNLAAAAALLIWAVRLVRTGFERAFGNQLSQRLKRSTNNRFAAASTGAAAAILLQSSTAVAILLAGFMSAGSIAGTAGLAIMLGADLGSAIVAQVLTSSISAVTPLLLLIGVLFFLRSSRRFLRQIGRILIGLALVFLSLDLIRGSSAPLLQSEGVSSAVAYLSDDLLTAFLLAVVFAWLVHSSVAAVLLFATLAAETVLPEQAAFAMVLGANLGGAFIAFFLTWNADFEVRRVIFGNLLLRGGGAVIALGWLFWLDAGLIVPGTTALQRTLNVHLAFNGALLLIGLGLLKPSAQLVAFFISPKNHTNHENIRSALDPTVRNHPARAFSCAQRELVDMGNRIETMLRDTMPLFDHFDETVAEKVRSEQRIVSQMSHGLRVYLSGVRSSDPNEDTGTRAFDLAGVATNLESGADVIARKVVSLARKKHLQKTNFSDAGRRELSDFHDKVLRNVQHGIAVLMSSEIGAARELVEQKEMIRDIEQKFERMHLTRLRQGLVESIETSAIHIDLLRSLKMLNTAFAMTAYPLLKEQGKLLESRLAGN